MYRLGREIEFCYGHRLMDYNGPCRNLHGHSARAEIYLAGEGLDSRGVLFDFHDLKEVMAGWIGETLDHKMLLKKGDPLVVPLKELGEPVVLFEDNPTTEAIAKRIYDFAAGKGLPVSEVRVWEDATSWASFGKGS